MPPRHASQCRRVLQSQAVTVRDNVWISDGQLAAAFERYCCISRQVRRKASNVPGPLESRRRLGRRQMAALNAIHNIQSLPLWVIPNTMDESRWQWQAPSSASDRQERQHRQSQPILSSGRSWATWPSSVHRWVGERLRLGHATGPQSVIAAEPGTREWEARQRVEVRATLTANGIASASLEEDIARFQALPRNTKMDVAASDFHQLVRKFQQCLVLGHVTKKNLPSLALQLRNAFEARWADSFAGGSLGLSLYAAVISGIETSPALSLTAVSASFWNTLLFGISKLPVNDDLSRLFARIMHAIPDAKLILVSDGVLSVLRAFFSSWASGGLDRGVPSISMTLQTASNASDRLQALLDIAPLPNSSPASLDQLRGISTEAKAAYEDLAHNLQLIDETISMDTQIRAVASALRNVSHLEHLELLEAALRLLPTPDPAALERSHQVRYAWLCVLAQMPLVNQEFLLDTGVRLRNSRGAQELDVVEICSLALSQWNSRGYLRTELAYRGYQKVWSGTESMVLASLFSAIFDAQPDKYRGLFVSLCTLMKALGSSHDIVNSFQALGSSRASGSSSLVRVSLLQEVALAAKDHHIAMSLHRLYRHHLYTPGGPEWDPAVFRGYARAMVVDPTVPPSAIWDSLDIEMHEPGPANRETPKTAWSDMLRHRGSFGEQRAAIIRELAVGFSVAPHLRNRVALRHVSQCIHFLTLYDGRLPIPVLKAIYQVVSRDLIQGLPGRTARLQWFMRLVSQHMRVDEAERCGLLLRRWRHSVKIKWEAQGMPDRQPTRVK